jgi:hypothetical protein
VLRELENALKAQAQREAVAILRRAFPNDVNLGWAANAVQWITGSAGITVPFRPDPHHPPAVRDREALCAAHVEKRMVAPYAQPAARAGLTHLGRAYDAFGDRFGFADWGIAMTLNHALMRLIRPRRRAAALVTMRDDGITILEWIAHYQALDFDHIFIFSNDNHDCSDALLAVLAARGLVSVIMQDIDLHRSSPQYRAFEYSLHLMDELRDFEWVFYLDSDEFVLLDPPHDHSIQTYLANIDLRSAGSPPAALLFHWQWYVSGGCTDWSPAPLLTRFTHSRFDSRCKCLVRLSEVTSMRQVHFPEPDTGLILDADLQPLAPDFTAQRGINDGGGRILHFWSKSWPEFLMKKRRGDTVYAPAHPSYRRDLDHFFTWNGPETNENKTPPPAELVARIERKLAALRADPDIAAAEQACRDCFPILVQQYCGNETPQTYYVRAQAIATAT